MYYFFHNVAAIISMAVCVKTKITAKNYLTQKETPNAQQNVLFKKSLTAMSDVEFRKKRGEKICALLLLGRECVPWTFVWGQWCVSPSCYLLQHAFNGLSSRFVIQMLCRVPVSRKQFLLEYSTSYTLILKYELSLSWLNVYEDWQPMFLLLLCITMFPARYPFSKLNITVP